MHSNSVLFLLAHSVSPVHECYPRVMWWDLTDTFFLPTGLEDLGFVIHLLHKHGKDPVCQSDSPHKNWNEKNDGVNWSDSSES